MSPTQLEPPDEERQKAHLALEGLALIVNVPDGRLTWTEAILMRGDGRRSKRVRPGVARVRRW